MALRGAMEMVRERIVICLEDLERLLPLYASYQEFLGDVPSVGLDAGESISAEELGKFRNQREALRYLAEMNGGILRVRDAARLIHDSQLSRGSLPNVRSALLRYVKESDEWVAEGKGWVRLTGRGRPELPGRTAPVPSASPDAVEKAKELRRQAEDLGVV